jgi:hypothetical protein
VLRKRATRLSALWTTNLASVSLGAMNRALAMVFVLALDAAALHAADAPQVTITISDSTAAEMLAQAYQANVGRKKETPEGYEKVEKIGDEIVRESYVKASQTGLLTSLFANHITIEVKTNGLPSSELRAWLARVDHKRLARVEADAESKVAPHSELSKALPEPPEGWTAERPNEVTTAAAGFTLSQADRVYKKK